MDLRLALMITGLGLVLCNSAFAAEDRLALAKPTGAVTPPALTPYKGKLHIQRGVDAPRLRMAPTTPVAPMKPVKIKPLKNKAN
jgi:hypothetical protein